MSTVHSQPLPVEHPWFDSRRAPLYVWTFAERFTDRELEDAIAAHRRWRESAAHDAAFVIDISHVTEATARQRWLVARHLADASDHAKRHVVATSIVVPGAFHHALMRTVFWIQAPPTPVRVARSLEEALQQCESALAARSRDKVTG